jgi:hypothetical protein
MLESAVWPEHRLPDATAATSAVQSPSDGQSTDAVIDEVRRALMAAEDTPLNPRQWFGLLGKARAAICHPVTVAQSQWPEVERVEMRRHFNPID